MLHIVLFSGILIVCVMLMTLMQINLFAKLLIQVILIVFGGFFCWECSIYKLFLYAIIHIFAMCTSELIVLQIWNLYNAPILSDNIIYEEFRLSLIVSMKAVQFLEIVLFEQIMEPYNGKNKLIENIPVLISSLSFIVIIESINFNMPYIKESNNKIWSLVGTSMVLASFIFYVIYTQNYFKIKNEAQKEKMALYELEMKYEYYQKRLADEDYVKSIYHDLKNHFLLTDNASIDEEIKKRLSLFETYYETGNEFLDIIVSEKMKTCKNKQIECECYIDFRNGDYISPLEISTIFGNLFDNAIEAVENLVDKEKYIYCNVKQQGEMLIVCMKNNFDKKNIKDKNNKTYHGFGLINVKNVVEKHGGCISTEQNMNEYIVSILLPIPQKINTESYLK